MSIGMRKAVLPASRTPNERRELRWSYLRGEAHHHCELSFDPAQKVYEFRSWDAEGAVTVRIESFSHAAEALDWHCAHEAGLLRAGFSLENFELAMEGNGLRS